MAAHLSRSLLTIMVVALAARSTAYAVDATIRVVHDDPDGVISPGQTVRFRIVASWQPQVQFAGVRFDVSATDQLGQSGNIYQYAAFGALHVLGQSHGGSVLGTDIAIVPNYFTASPYGGSFQHTGLDLLRFDWIAPQPSAVTPVEFALVREPIRPNARFYPLLNSPAWVEANTTWVNASVLVLPAPASAVALGCGAIVACRRRRGH